MLYRQGKYMKNLSIKIPEKVSQILGVLKKEGYEAYAVGGCVRDSILGRTPKDWDITTSASPFEVKRLFRRTVDTGIKHGTVTVLCGNEGYEVTTYRLDGNYEDARHPDHVEFTSSLKEDLKRRDFTINAMAYTPDTGLVDLFDGLRDLNNKIIRCVGIADDRFDEDALRIMRAVRFAAQLGFSIEDNTVSAIKNHAERLKLISAERIRDELIKLLMSPNPHYIKYACDYGITAVILPEYDHIRGVAQNTRYHIYDVEEHTLKALCSIDNDEILRVAMLIHDFGKPDVKTTSDKGVDSFKGHPALSAEIADRILRRLKFDNYSRQRVVRLVRWHDIRYMPSERNVRFALYRVGDDLFEDLLKVQYADLLAKNPALIEEETPFFREIEAIYKKVIAGGQCYSLKDLAVTGQDLIEAGLKPGPYFKEILDRMLMTVIEDQDMNDREKLMSIFRYQL